MGLVCAIERRIKSIHTHAHYNYNLTGIPAYDKVNKTTKPGKV